MADEQVRFRAVSASTSEADDGTAGAARKLTLVGSIPELGFWLLGKGVSLHQEKTGAPHSCSIKRLVALSPSH